jgi:hypothetical protein
VGSLRPFSDGHEAANPYPSANQDADENHTGHGDADSDDRHTSHRYRNARGPTNGHRHTRHADGDEWGDGHFRPADCDYQANRHAGSGSGVGYASTYQDPGATDGYACAKATHTGSSHQHPRAPYQHSNNGHSRALGHGPHVIIPQAAVAENLREELY